jgi:hypothetical protein
LKMLLALTNFGKFFQIKTYYQGELKWLLK